jgi:hypothetical protein
MDFPPAWMQKRLRRALRTVGVGALYTLWVSFAGWSSWDAAAVVASLRSGRINKAVSSLVMMTFDEWNGVMGRILRLLVGSVPYAPSGGGSGSRREALRSAT